MIRFTSILNGNRDIKHDLGTEIMNQILLDEEYPAVSPDGRASISPGSSPWLGAGSSSASGDACFRV